jgi:hypothetical protein
MSRNHFPSRNSSVNKNVCLGPVTDVSWSQDHRLRFDHFGCQSGQVTGFGFTDDIDI